MATTKSRTAAKPRPVAIADTTPPDLLDLYIEELSNEPVATAEAQKALARRMRNTKLSAEEREAARDELIRANLRFAFSVAKQYQNHGLPLEDLVGEGNKTIEAMHSDSQEERHKLYRLVQSFLEMTSTMGFRFRFRVTAMPCFQG